MAINPKAKGTMRYYRDFVFHQAVQDIARRTGRPVMVSQAKAMRERVDERLGKPLHAAKQAEAQQAIAAEIEESTGTAGVLSLAAGADQMKRWTADFSAMLAGTDGEAGPRIAVSPYDPRWSGRGTVKQNGTPLLYIAEADANMIMGHEEDLSQLEVWDSEQFMLKSIDEKGRITDAGPARSWDDITGMTEFIEFMPEREWRVAKQWVDDGLRTDGVLDRSKAMSEGAKRRAVAVMRELSEQGTPFEVRRDVNPGQLKAVITGTGLSIRVADIGGDGPRTGDSFVGHRIYDDGAQMYFATPGILKGPVLGLPKDHPEYSRGLTVLPTPKDCVNILRFAQGLPVQRRDSSLQVGEQDSYRLGRDEVQASYHTGNGTSSFAYADVKRRDGSPVPGAKMMIHRDGSSRTARFTRRGVEGSEDFLRAAIESARENLLRAVDVESLIEEHDRNREAAAAGEHFPAFSGDPEVASIQRSYWDVLRGQQDMLLRPGATEDQYEELTGAIGQQILTEEQFKGMLDELAAPVAYTGDPEDMVRAHAADLPDGRIGELELHPVATPDGLVEKRFDPVRVGKHMTSEHGLFRNNADVTWALKQLAIDPDELLGESEYAKRLKDEMISFDPATAVGREQIADPFARRMADLVHDTVSRSGAVPISVEIDDQGVIRWEAERLARSGKREAIVGEVGQVFSPGEHGAVTTRFGSGEDYLFVPGAEALIRAQQPGEAKSVEERIVLRDYERIMSDRVQYQVANDAASKLSAGLTQVGEPTSLNGVYRQLYDVRHDVDFVQRAQREGMDAELVSAVLETEGRRVRFANDVRDGSTANAEYRERQGLAGDPANDSFGDAWARTGQRNMMVMGGDDADGYFDPILTSSALNQGIIRYRTAEAAPDGSLVRAARGSRVPLAEHPSMEHLSKDPVDRQQMVLSNALKMRRITEPVGVAMTPLDGWNFDDAYVVSKDFAERNEIRGADGEMRPLTVGDKLNLHGNKGVISLVVDRAMDPAEAQGEGLENPVEVFANNPDLDVVISPFSPVSRYNGGLAREMMQRSGRLWGLDEAELDGGIGEAQVLVTDHAVDAKTNIYGQEEIAQGRGRRASAQLAWALGSQGADDVMAEIYGGNTSAVSNFKEMLVAVGLDMAPDGTLVRGRWTAESEGVLGDANPERRIFEMPELVRRADGGLNTNAMRQDFGQLIGDRGGELEMPFPLTFPAAGEDEAPAGIPRGEKDGTWLMPIMSAHLRSGQEMVDGLVRSHEYTNWYMQAFDAANRYRHEAERVASGTLDQRAERDSRRKMGEAHSQAQSAFSSIGNDLVSRRFSGRRNSFKESLMSARMPHSATAVWSPDPRLDLDQVGMSRGMADQLGLKDDDYALIWRDPVLRDSGVRYMRVKVDDRLTGVTINPVMDKPFDGDFDGDSVAVVRLTSRAAQEEARRLLSVEANLLDRGVMNFRTDPETGEPSLDPETGLPEPADCKHPLNIQDALDLKVAETKSASMRDELQRITQQANDLRFDLDEGLIDEDEFLAGSRASMHELSELVNHGLMGMTRELQDQATLRFDGVESHAESVREACIVTGAKGSEEKLGLYLKHMGVDPETMEDTGVNMMTREHDENVWRALGVKTLVTGVAGAVSQRGVQQMRNQALRETLEATYPSTQSVLQIKHDAQEGFHKENMLRGPAKDLWRGRKIVRGEDGWQVYRDDEGNTVQDDASSFARTFYDFHTSKDGLNVQLNPEHVLKIVEVRSHQGRMVDLGDPDMMLEVDMPDASSPMDRLAYGGEFKDLVSMARDRTNLFDGAKSGHFAPYPVRTNQMEKRHAEMGLVPEPGYVGIGDRTSEANGPAKGRRRSDAAQTVRAPKHLDVSSVFEMPESPEERAEREARAAERAAMPGHDRHAASRGERPVGEALASLRAERAGAKRPIVPKASAPEGQSAQQQIDDPDHMPF